jgi:hypothetical protein
LTFAFAAIGGGGVTLVGLLFAGFGAVAAIVGSNKASQYESAHAEYRRRRASINVERFLEEARAGPDESGISPQA